MLLPNNFGLTIFFELLFLFSFASVVLQSLWELIHSSKNVIEPEEESVDDQVKKNDESSEKTDKIIDKEDEIVKDEGIIDTQKTMQNKGMITG